MAYLLQQYQYNNQKRRIMTNLERLLIGIKEIAENHGFQCNTDYEDEGEVCIYGGCNVPTLADVQILCDAVGIERESIESSECGIDVFFTEEWWESKANEYYATPSVLELWVKRN